MRVLEGLIIAIKWVFFLPFGVWLGGFLIFIASVYFMAPPTPLPQLDAAIILTGGTNRVDQGLNLLAQKNVHLILITGVHRGVKKSDLIRIWPGDPAAIHEEDITLGYEAGNTIGNALEAMEWIKNRQIGSAYIITANYHTPRAMLELRHAVPSVRLVAYPVNPNGFDWREKLFWKTNIIEYHKVLISLYRVIIHPGETQPVPSSLVDPSSALQNPADNKNAVQKSETH